MKNITLLLCKKSKFQLFIFGLLPTSQDPGSPQGASPYKTAKNHKVPTAYLGRGPFYEKSPNSNSAFRLIFLRLWAKNQNSTPNIFFASSSRFQNGTTQPPHFKTLEGDRFGGNPLFQGQGLTRGPWGLIHPPENYLL